MGNGSPPRLRSRHLLLLLAGLLSANIFSLSDAYRRGRPPPLPPQVRRGGSPYPIGLGSSVEGIPLQAGQNHGQVQIKKQQPQQQPVPMPPPQQGFAHRRIQHFGPPIPKFRGKHPHLLRRPLPPPPPHHHHRGPPLQPHLHPPPPMGSRPTVVTSPAQLVVPLPPSQQPSLDPFNVNGLKIPLPHNSGNSHHILTMQPPLPNHSLDQQSAIVQQHIFSAQSSSPSQPLSGFSNGKPIIEYAPPSSYFPGEPFIKDSFLQPHQNPLIHSLDEKSSQEFGSKPQIIQVHLPTQNPNDKNPPANIIQIHITSTQRPTDTQENKDYFSGSTFKPPVDTLNKNDFVNSKPIYGPPPGYPNTEYRPSESHRPNSESSSGSDEDRQSGTHVQDHFVENNPEQGHDKPNYNPYLNRNSNEVSDKPYGGAGDHGKTAYENNDQYIPQRRPLEGTHYNKGNPSIDHAAPPPGFNSPWNKESGSPVQKPDIKSEYGPPPPRNDYANSEPNYRPPEQEYGPPPLDGQRNAPHIDFVRDEEYGENRNRDAESDHRNRDREQDYSKDDARRPIMSISDRPHLKPEYGPPKPEYGPPKPEYNHENAEDAKYSQPDPLYHPGGEVTKPSDDIPNQSPPDRYDNSFSNNFNQKERENKHKYTEQDNGSRFSVGSGKHSPSGEAMAASVFSGSTSEADRPWYKSDKITNPGRYEPLNLMEYIRTKVEENERSKEPLYSRPSDPPTFHPPESDEQGYPGTSYKLSNVDRPSGPGQHMTPSSQSHYSSQSKVKGNSKSQFRDDHRHNNRQGPNDSSKEYSTISNSHDDSLSYRHPPPSYLSERRDHDHNSYGHDVQVHGGHSYNRPHNDYESPVTPAYGDSYPMYVTEPDPIIEIIVQDSNVTLPPLPKAPTPPPVPSTPEPVHVFYVRYSANNKSNPEITAAGGYSNRGGLAGPLGDAQINLEMPIASIPIRQPEVISSPTNVPTVADVQQQTPQASPSHPQHSYQQPPVTSTEASVPPFGTTTFRTIIRPDKNQYSSSHLGVTFDHPPNPDAILQQHLQQQQQHIYSDQNQINHQQASESQNHQQQAQHQPQLEQPQHHNVQPVPIQQQQHQQQQHQQEQYQQQQHQQQQQQQQHQQEQQQQQQHHQHQQQQHHQQQQQQQHHQQQQQQEQQHQQQHHHQQPQLLMHQNSGPIQNQNPHPSAQDFSNVILAQPPTINGQPQGTQHQLPQAQLHQIQHHQNQQAPQQLQTPQGLPQPLIAYPYSQHQQTNPNTQKTISQDSQISASNNHFSYQQPPQQSQVPSGPPTSQFNPQLQQQQQFSGSQMHMQLSPVPHQQNQYHQQSNSQPTIVHNSNPNMQPDFNMDPMWSDWNQNSQQKATAQNRNDFQGSYSDTQGTPSQTLPEGYDQGPHNSQNFQQRSDQDNHNNNYATQQLQQPFQASPQITDEMLPPSVQEYQQPYSNMPINPHTLFDANPRPYYPIAPAPAQAPPLSHMSRMPNYDNIGMQPPVGPVYPGFSKRMGLEELTSFLENNNPSLDTNQKQSSVSSGSQEHSSVGVSDGTSEPQQYDQQQSFQGSSHQLINKFQLQSQSSSSEGSGASSTGLTMKPSPAKLPDDVPEDLKQQLMSSGILGNADIQVINFDENLFKELGDLPPEALAALGQQSSGLGLSEANLNSNVNTNMPSSSNIWQGGSASFSGGSSTDLSSALGTRHIRDVLIVRNNRSRPKRGGSKKNLILFITDKDDVLLYNLKRRTLIRVGDTHKPILSRAIELSNHKFNIQVAP